MKVFIKHSLPGRLRLGYNSNVLSSRQAILAQSLIAVQEGINDIQVNPLVGSFLVYYDSSIISEKEILNLFAALTDKYLNDQNLLDAVAIVPETDSTFGILFETAFNVLLRRLLPLPIRNIILYSHIIPRVGRALLALMKGTIFSTDLLDATALSVAVLSGNTATASSVSLLLEMGEQIEGITRKRSYNNLAQTLLISNESVHILVNDEEKTVPASTLKKGDTVIVRAGSQIPADGTVIRGTGMANQASITGESLPVEKSEGSTVFAGTILEEGEIVLTVISTGKDTKVHNIISLIDQSQSLKATVQRRSEKLAEQIVPFNFLLTLITWLITRNVTKTISTLMVDYSCAMKLAAPIAVLSAMKEAATWGISVKGGKYLEEAAQAQTIIFDKTGTLTYATPTLTDIYPMKGYTKEDILIMAACLEEHFPHPLGRAVVQAAEEQHLRHPENHAKVEYIVAHGIASTLDGKKLRIGSKHFIFEDEGIPFTNEIENIHSSLQDSGSSLLYLAIDGKLAGILAIGDPVRKDAKEAIATLKRLGIKKCMMITGDTEGAAKKIATETGVDAWHAQALPEDKVSFVEAERKAGNKVIMIGDGINDAPALSAATLGIAIDGCSSIAGDTADIVLSKDGLAGIVAIRQLGMGLLDRINRNNALIIGANSALLAGGIFGFISPSLAALLHNSLTIGISLSAMQPVLPEFVTEIEDQ
ncbi:MAG: heavy metal translocating P-type ATPase [Treponema sp.]|nr:heavy metal translocating P-type ATPase [Treponema sp.]